MTSILADESFTIPTDGAKKCLEMARAVMKQFAQPSADVVSRGQTAFLAQGVIACSISTRTKKELESQNHYVANYFKLRCDDGITAL